MPNKLKKQERQMMLWESEDCIVPMKPAVQADGAKLGNASGGKAVRPIRVSNQASAIHSDGSPLLNRLERITKRAEADKAARFNNLYSALTYELLYEAFCRLKRGKTPGVDGVTLEEYGVNLIANLRSLVDRLHRQSYGPQSSLRRLIPKGNGKTRPLGIATVEDKIVQRTVVMILEPIYELDFLGRYSLELAEDKTKLIRFGRFAARDNQRAGKGAPSTFDFLGFTHYCGLSRGGKFKLKRKTAMKKFRQKVAALKEWFRENLTTPCCEVWEKLNAKLSGHYQYYNVNDNWRWLMKYREVARRFGLRWLRRRSHKGSSWSWEKYRSYLEHHSLAVPGQITDLFELSRTS